MDIGQLLGNANPLLIGLGLCALCIVGVILLFSLQLLSSVFDIIGTVFELLFGAIGGEPTSCCGCITVIGGCALVGGLIAVANSLLSTCGTPQATNWCNLLGR
jgi:hypothetical protein